MESLQDQLDEVLLKSNWQIEEIAEREREREQLATDVTENISKRVLTKNI